MLCPARVSCRGFPGAPSRPRTGVGRFLLFSSCRGGSSDPRGSISIFFCSRREPGSRVAAMSTAVKLHSSDARSIPFQEASLDIWDKKYRLSAKDGTPIDRSMDDTYKRVARALADVEAPEVRETLERAVPVGVAPWRDPGRPRHVERRREGAQACHVDDQLHRVGHHPRLDGRHPRQGARGRPHAEGRLRHRLRILDAASARRVRVGRGRLYLGPALVHGYLRQDVLHRLVGRRPPRRADGHVRHRPSRRDGIHPRQARSGPVAPVQPVAAGHRRVHAGGARGQGLAPRLPRPCR